MKWNKSIGAWLLLLLIALPSAAQQRTNVVDEVAWIVGDETILLSDIERQKLFYESMGQTFQGNARCRIPEQMAIQKLFLNQAVIDSVYPNDAMVTQAVNQWLEQATNQIGGRDRMEEYFGMPYAKIREERHAIIEEEFVVMQMRNKLVSDITVTPSEVNRFYDTANKDSLPFIPLTVEVQIITKQPKMDLRAVDEVKERLIKFTEDVNSGKADFETLARIYSQDGATALRGGEIGFVGRAELEPEFANVAFGLSDPNKVSRIVETKRGYHIIQLIEKRNDLINVRHIMLRPELNAEELTSTVHQMDSIAGLIRSDSIPFNVAARYFSDDEDSRLANGQMTNNDYQSSHYGTARFAMEELPPEVAKVVADLEEGELSAPFTMLNKNNQTVVAIAKLRRRIPGHRANVVDDYQVVKGIVEQNKQAKLLDEWIREKQKSIYVRISPAYRDCDFEYPGWLDNSL